MADHARDIHKGVISADLMANYEFACTGAFTKPLHRQVDENLRITRDECEEKLKVGRKVWKIELPFLNCKQEYWAPRNMTFTYSNFNRHSSSQTPLVAQWAVFVKSPFHIV